MQTMELAGEEKERRTIYYLGCAAFVLCVLYAILIHFTQFSISRYLLPCLFHSITGYYCPGCGGTRAITVLMQGEVLRSLYYHPLVIYGAILYLWFMITNTIEIVSKRRWRIGLRYRQWYVNVGIVILAINFIIKNVVLLIWHYPMIF